MTDVWLITGIPGAGKSTVARLLAERLGRGVHIEGDLLQDFIVSGGVWPGEEPAEESSRQIRLNITNQCLLARSFAEAGFTPVIDYVIGPASLRLYRELLGGLRLRLVVLEPGRDAALARDRGRPKSRAFEARHGKTIAEAFAHLDEMIGDLRPGGLRLDTSALSAEQTVAAILSDPDGALLT